MSQPLTFVTYNVHKAIGTDGVRDPARIISVLREIDADVLILQEADRRLGQRASVLPRALIDDTPWKVVPVSRRPRSIGWHGNALLVRRNMTIVESYSLDLPTLEPRGAVSAVLKANGQRFRVVGTHLDLSGLRRRDQVAAILRHCADCSDGLPSLVAGDFNQWSARRGAMRAFPADWLVLAPGPTFPSRRPIARLDRLAFSRGWRIHSLGVHHSQLSAQASDHLPTHVSAQIVSSA